MQWEQFLRSVALGTDYGYEFMDDTRGARSCEAAPLSTREAAVEVTELEN